MSELLPEPEQGSVVRDADGDVWHRQHEGWFLAGSDIEGRSWRSVCDYAPLWLLVDGPLIT